MLFADVTAMVDDVRAMAGDPEAAHGAEDRLYLAVLGTIATGQCRDASPEDFAAEALKASAVEFDRWRA
jgi:hypothetical protein